MTTNGTPSGTPKGRKRPRRRYDDKFRANAVVMLEAAGYPDRKGALEQVSKHLRVPHPTLHRWITEKNNPAPSDIVQEKRGELASELKDIAYALVGAIPGKIDEATLQQTATSLGIIIDKMQLLTGQPTEIIEDVRLTDEERSRRITGILDRARVRRDRPATIH